MSLSLTFGFKGQILIKRMRGLSPACSSKAHATALPPNTRQVPCNEHSGNPQLICIVLFIGSQLNRERIQYSLSGKTMMQVFILFIYWLSHKFQGSLHWQPGINFIFFKWAFHKYRSICIEPVILQVTPFIVWHPSGCIAFTSSSFCRIEPRQVLKP